MQNCDVLLIQPRAPAAGGFQQVAAIEPLGLETVGGALKQAGYEVQLVDFPDDVSLERALRERRPAFCGISCSFTMDVSRVLQLTRTIKWVNPNIRVFVGGHHASLNPEHFEGPTVEAIVVGEGERTAVELLEAWTEDKDPLEVPGLYVRQGENLRATAPRPPLRKLDMAPLPAHELVSAYRRRYFLGLAHPVGAVETARGCPFRCNFCSVWRFHGEKIRFKGVERTVQEIAEVPARHVLITDDNFLMDVRRAALIAEELKKLQVKKRYVIQARSDTISRHPEVIRLWKEVGLNSVFIGFEQVTDEGLERVEKRNSVANNERALEVLKQYGVNVIASFIVDPAFDAEDFDRLRRYVVERRIHMPAFSILTPLPGTKLFEELKERIQTWRWEQFDLLHSVLPTRLDPQVFYEQFASLYTAAYRPLALLRKTGPSTLRSIFRGEVSLRHLWRMWRAFRRLMQQQRYGFASS